MSENEIKPVAWVRAAMVETITQEVDFLVKCGPLQERGGDKPLYDQSAIDQLTAECDALRADAERYRAVIEYALAQHNGGHTPYHNHWAIKAANELSSIDAARAKEPQA